MACMFPGEPTAYLSDMSIRHVWDGLVAGQPQQLRRNGMNVQIKVAKRVSSTWRQASESEGSLVPSHAFSSQKHVERRWVP